MKEQLISKETAILAKEKGFTFFNKCYTNLDSIWYHEIESVFLNDKIEINGKVYSHL